MNKQFRLAALCVASLVILPACFGDKKEVVKTTEEVTVTETTTPATDDAKEVMEMPAAEATTEEAK